MVTGTEPFTTIETAIRTCRDLIFAAAVMEDLSGIDLACALRAMPISRDLPFVLVTSLEPTHPSFVALPPTVPKVRWGRLLATTWPPHLPFSKSARIKLRLTA